MGLRSVNIGYANLEIAQAAFREIMKGNNLTRASYTELRAAESLIDLIPSVEMVKFAKHGSTVTTAAVKLARAYTGRKFIAVPKEQPFFSFDDWFIGSTEVAKGTLNDTSNFTIKFNYGDITSLEKLFDQYPNQIAGVILEPATSLLPCKKSCDLKSECYNCSNSQNNFLHQVRKLTKEKKSLMILDEMITGFRWHLNGAQYFYNVNPDLCTFGKAMANGFAVAALCGKKEIMSLGSILDKGEERVFLTSTTHGAEMSSLGAFLKTIEILRRESVIKKNWDFGEKLIEESNKIVKKHKLDNCLEFGGLGCSPNYTFRDIEGISSFELKTLFLQEMIKENILMPYISISQAHGEEELQKTLEGMDKSFEKINMALNGDFNSFLESKIIKPVFIKYN